MIIGIPTLETDRLILRAPSLDDFEAEAGFFASPRSAGVGGTQTRDQVWRYLAFHIGHWAFRGYGMFAIVEKSSGIYCGRSGPYFPEGWPEPEIGWTVMQAAEGRGIAFEAATRTRQYAYDTLGWDTAISLIAASNQRSQTLAKRLDATLESSYVHPQFGDMQVWRHPAAGVLQ
ncbi:MAG: GNAT family N-acetyltransferase [Rhodobacterales bacterium]|jgi:RimJ/RimL family protein N-acetyltransferase|nr:GNAT family N-acetyltransferase [Rhodobacter sp.]